MENGTQEEMFLAIAHVLGIWKMKILYFFCAVETNGWESKKDWLLDNVS
jgi:hypothetical protein